MTRKYKMAEATGNELHDGASVPGGLRMLDVLVVLAQHKRLLIGLPLLLGALGLAVSMLMTPIFKSTARIMPPQQQNSGMAAMLGQLGGLAGAAGGLGALKNPGDLYVGLLESRTVADRLIARLKLRERYSSKTMDQARRDLAGNTVIATGKKDGFITITTSDPDPAFAAQMANVYVEELTRLTQTMALSEASQRRLFFEKQLKDARDQLAEAEVSLRGTQEKTGMIQPEAQVQSIIASVAQVKGAIAAKEVEIKGMRTFASSGNPDLLRAQEELRGLQGQLGKLERSEPSKQGQLMGGSAKIPEVGVEYVRRVRDVKYYETIFELLAKQFELAKIDEAKDAPLIQLLDKAIPAEHKSKPSRALISLGAAAFGLVLALVLAFLHAAYQSSRQQPANAAHWQMLAEALGRRAPRRPA